VVNRPFSAGLVENASWGALWLVQAQGSVGMMVGFPVLLSWTRFNGENHAATQVKIVQTIIVLDIAL
jgi:hypothetical protein